MGAIHDFLMVEYIATKNAIHFMRKDKQLVDTAFKPRESLRE